VPYHFDVKIVQRSKGQNAIAAAAYQARDLLHDLRTGLIKDFSKERDDLIFDGIFAPKGAPAWANNREQLWNTVEKREGDTPNRQTARRIVAALPNDLSDQQRRYIVSNFANKLFREKGFIVDVAIHAPSHGDERNYHAHFLVTMRQLKGDGFGNKDRTQNKQDTLDHWRDVWARECGKQFELEAKKAGTSADAQARLMQEAERWRHSHLTAHEQCEKALARGDADYAEACLETLSRDERPRHKGAYETKLERQGKTAELIDLKEARAERERCAEMVTLAMAEMRSHETAQEAATLQEAAVSEVTPKKDEDTGETVNQQLECVAAEVCQHHPQGEEDRERQGDDGTGGDMPQR